MDASFDGIIIGAGHNGLILQAYLGRLGLRLLSIDRNLQPGGGLATIEDPAFPGVFHNIHSVFHRAVTLCPWYRDLELEQRAQARALRGHPVVLDRDAIDFGFSGPCLRTLVSNVSPSTNSIA